MSSFTLPRIPAPGSSISANWGREVVNYLRRLTPIAGKGMKFEMTPNGTVYNSTPGVGAVSALTEASLKPFDIRWFSYGDNDGEWQIYIPLGNVSLDMRAGLGTYPCMCVNDAASDGDGNEIFGWYRIEEPTQSDGLVQTINGIVHQSFPVYVLLKPWPRFMVSTNKDAFGTVFKSHVVGTMNIAEYSNGGSQVTSRVGVRAGVEGIHDSDASSDSRFDIVYDIGDLYGNTDATAKVVNMIFSGGRTMISSQDEVDVTDWDEVWLKVSHNVEHAKDITLTIEPSGEFSDDTCTYVLLYRMKDGVVTEDHRASVLGSLHYYDY